MKRIFSAIFVAIASMAMFASCEGVDQAEPAVSIDNVTVVDGKLTFTINPVKLQSYEYAVKAGEEVLKEESVSPAEAKTVEMELGSEIKEVLISVKGLAKDGVTAVADEKHANVETGGAAYFFKRVNILQFTATWCGFCPNMVTSLNKVEDKYPGRIAVIAVHGSDAIEVSSSSNLLMKKFNVSGYPTAVMDYKASTAYPFSQVIKAIRDRIDNAPATTDIKLSAALEGESVRVTANIKNIKEDAEYMIGCALVEDGIKIKGGTSKTGIYDRVLRKFYTKEVGQMMEDASGAPISTLPLDQETTIEIVGDFDSKWVAENCIVVFYTFKKAENGKWYVDNCNEVTVGGVAEYLGEEYGFGNEQ